MSRLETPICRKVALFLDGGIIAFSTVMRLPNRSPLVRTLVFRPLLAVLLATPAAGCLGPLDTLGYGDDVTENEQLNATPQLEDDKLEDKHPTYDPTRTVVETLTGPDGGRCEMTLNKSATVTKLDIIPFDKAGAKALEGKLYRGRREALAAVAESGGPTALPSMEILNGYLKPFNDGLYAAIELGAETGAASAGPDKRGLLTALLARLITQLQTGETTGRAAFEEAATTIGAALILGGDTPALASPLSGRAQTAANTFTASPDRARPIGFYTWTPALERIFTRDRFLQSDELARAAPGLAFVLGRDPALLADYQRATALYAGLTNPYVSYTVDALIPYVPTTAALADTTALAVAFAADHASLDVCAPTSVSVLPASHSHEVDYFAALACAAPLPEGTNLMDLFIAGIRSGDVDLTPRADSGWYDYQTWALETLLLPERGPESQHLLLTAGYKRKLIETFKSLLIQNRETHVKQVASFGGATSGPPPPPVDLYPLLPAEPFPTFYLRSARGYRFLRTFLQAAMGPDFLAGTARLLETANRAPLTLAAELDQRVQLLYGLAFVTADAVGMSRTEGILSGELAELDVDAAIKTARDWLKAWPDDPDIDRDPRVIIPIGIGAEITTYWAVIGVKPLISRAEFVAGHEPEVVSGSGCWTGKLVPADYTLLGEETAEVQLRSNLPPPTRDELRALCDMYQTKDEIIAALEAL